MFIFKRNELKNFIVISILILLNLVSIAQPVSQRSSDAITVMDGNLFAKNSFRPAVFQDTTAGTIGLDSCGKLIFTYSDNSYWIRACSPKRWVKLLKTGDVANATWGSITGTLSNQTDLQNALNLKFNISDTANKWVQDAYVRSDSLFKFKNGTETFLSRTSIIANNGLSQTVDSVQLGQLVGAVGNPAALHNSREIPLNGYNVAFTGATGAVTIGTTSTGSAKANVVATGNTRAIAGSSVNGNAINVSTSGTGSAVFGQTLGTGFAAIYGSNAGSSGYAVYGVSSNNGTIPLGAAVFNTNNNLSSPVVAEFTRNALSGLSTDGIGMTLMFRTQSTGSIDMESGQIRNGFSTALHASRSSFFEWHLVNNAVSARKALLSSAGQWTWDGYPALTAQSDTTTYKPIAIDGSGNVVKMAGWSGSGGGGGGATLNNIGTGFAWAATPTGDIKRAANSNTITWDSTSTANSLTAKVDTSVIATQYDLTQLSGIAGSGVANQLTYWTGTSSVAGDPGLTMNATTNTIISDTNRLKRINVIGDSTFGAKIEFFPSKTKAGSVSASIGYGEANNEHDLDTSVNNTLEGKIGNTDGTGAYIRWGMEKRWMPYPGAGFYQFESHPIEVKYPDTNLVIRPISWTGAETGFDGTMLLKSNSYLFDNWNGQRNLAAINNAGGFWYGWNDNGSGSITIAIRDTTSATSFPLLAGAMITGQVSGGVRLSTWDFIGQQINANVPNGITWVSSAVGANSNYNYQFDITSGNTGQILHLGKSGQNAALQVYNNGHITLNRPDQNDDGSQLQVYGTTNTAITSRQDNSGTNDVTYPMDIDRFSSGTVAAGFGFGIRFRTQTSNVAAFPYIGNITYRYTDPTQGTEDADFVVENIRAGTQIETFRVLSTGAARFNNAFTFPTAAAASPGMVLTDVAGDGTVTWETPAGSATTIYSGDGTLAGDRVVAGATNDLSFDNIFNFRINSNSIFQSKAAGGVTYSTTILGAGNFQHFGYTPVPATYSKGSAIILDTNNNVGLGVQPPTTMPLYATGLSTFVNGFQNQAGNYYKVDVITSDVNAGIDDYFFVIDATSGNVTITLPAASTVFGSGVGIQYVFKRIDNSGNSVTISRAGSDLIDGATSTTLTTQYEVKEIQAISTSAWAIK